MSDIGKIQVGWATYSDTNSRMSKITFRADDELVERIETLDGSKSEVMREALREYLDGREADSDADESGPSASRERGDSLDAFLAERVDELVDAKFAARERARSPAPERGAQDVNVNVTLEGDAPVRGRAARGADADAQDARAGQSGGRAPSDEADHDCGQCGETLSDDHVYCPNCGEKASRRVFCECGDEVRSDWSFCPGCGRRTPAADVLDRS